MSSDAFDTCNGSIDYDKVAHADDENRRNVILVGTKLDLVRSDPAKRQVEFSEAKELARKLKLAAAMEISSKEDTQLGEKDWGMTEVSACFLMTALFSYKNQVAEMKRARILAAKNYNPSSIGKHTLYPQAAVGNMQSRPPNTLSEDYQFNLQVKNCWEFNEKNNGKPGNSYNGKIQRKKYTESEKD